MYNSFEDRINNAFDKVLAAQYDVMVGQMRWDDSFFEKSLENKVFYNLYNTCTIPISSFAEKIAFMKQYQENVAAEKRRLEIEKLKIIKDAIARYDSKSPFWKLTHKKLKPDNYDFSSMSNAEISELYAENQDNSKKSR